MILSFLTDSIEPDQTARSSLIRVYTVSPSSCIYWKHYSLVKPHYSYVRIIITICLGVPIFHIFKLTIIVGTHIQIIQLVISFKVTSYSTNRDTPWPDCSDAAAFMSTETLEVTPLFTACIKPIKDGHHGMKILRTKQHAKMQTLTSPDEPPHEKKKLHR